MTAWRSFALRRVLSRMRIGPDVVRHLTTFQRLGATLDATPPTETWHLAARTALRALRTRSTIDVSPDWLWPQWLRDQLDPQHAAFTPRGHLPVMQNVTGRNWTMVGNPGSVWEAVVDPRGLVTPALDTWSLDWWVRSSGRWRFPSREQHVRQSLVGSAPVVATELAVDGGTVTHRVYAIRTRC